MALMIPVEVRNDQKGTAWYAFALVNLELNGRGKDRASALEALKKKLAPVYGKDIELYIQSENVKFPTALSVEEYIDWASSRSKVS